MSNSDVRRMPVEDLDAFAAIVANAYPAIDIGAPEKRRQYVEQLAKVQREESAGQCYGLYRGGRLLGGMRLFDFDMTVFETRLLAGGVGLVAVDLLHKKEHVARDMVAAFLRHYRAEGAPLATLYPFRPDFYRQMGFGYGTPMNRYTVRPAQLPPGPKEGLVFLTPDDKAEVLGCYNRFAARTHGMIQRAVALLDGQFANPENRLVGYRAQGQLRGYLVFQYKKGRTFIQNDIEVAELVYEDRAALAALVMFLRTQADQIGQVIFHTQDPYFYQLLLDPRNGSENLFPHVYHESHATGIGLMYRLVDTAGFFRALPAHSFGGVTCRLRLSVEDSFLPENSGALTLQAEDGRVTVSDDPACDVALRIGVAELSSLVMGALPLSRLWRYGQADLSDPAFLPLLTRMFHADEPPVCMTRF